MFKIHRNIVFIRKLCFGVNSQFCVSNLCGLCTFPPSFHRGLQIAFYATDRSDKGPSKSSTPPTEDSLQESSGSESDSESGYKSEEQLKQMRVRLMEAALKHVNTVGWSRQALALGAADTGLLAVFY